MREDDAILLRPLIIPKNKTVQKHIWKTKSYYMNISILFKFDMKSANLLLSSSLSDKFSTRRVERMKHWLIRHLNDDQMF